MSILIQIYFKLTEEYTTFIQICHVRNMQNIRTSHRSRKSGVTKTSGTKEQSQKRECSMTLHKKIGTKTTANNARLESRDRNGNVNSMAAIWEDNSTKLSRSPGRNNKNSLHPGETNLFEAGMTRLTGGWQSRHSNTVRKCQY